ncbi:MAG: DNA methyltransferase, partial [Betaproteobacteria bacterium]
PSRDYEDVFLFSKRERYYWDREAVRQPGREWKGAAGTFKRESGKMTALQVPGQSYASHRANRDDRVPPGRNMRAVWSIPTRSFPGEHFATFPPELVEPCILAGTSAAGCCPKCGKPWVRIVEKGEPDREWQARCGADASGGYKGKARKDYAGSRAQDPSAVKARILAGMRKTWTIGWRPTCKCNAGDLVPAVVLDPFAGVLTTLYVAEKLGRDSIGIELNPAYIELGKQEYMKALAATGVQRPLWA